MAVVKVQVSGLPVALREMQTEAVGPLSELAREIRSVIRLVLDDSHQIKVDYGYVGLMPPDGYKIWMSVPSLSLRLVSQTNAETAAAAMLATIVHFADAHVPEYHHIDIYPTGRRIPLGWLEWDHPRYASGDSILELVLAIEGWQATFSGKERAARAADDDEIGDEWARLRVWAEEVQTVVERMHGTPERPPPKLRSV